MSDPATQTVQVNGHPCRVWRKGAGPKIETTARPGAQPLADQLAAAEIRDTAMSRWLDRFLELWPGRS
jgi:hypothetical protein